MKTYYVYILSSTHGMLYVGMTNDLLRRIYEHKNELVDGFTKQYHIHRLVYYEETQDIESAFLREKEIKRWRRRKKINLIESNNPKWKDLSTDWFDDGDGECNA